MLGRRYDLEVMTRLINEEREAAGVAPLRRDRQLDHIALRYVIYRTWCSAVRPHLLRDDQQTIDRRLRDADVSFTYCGENIAVGATPKEVLGKLRVGTTNRRNILDPSYRRLGLASHAEEDRDLPDWFAPVLYCQVFTN